MSALDELLGTLRGGSDLHLRVGQPPLLRSTGSLTALPAPVVTPDYLRALLAEAAGAEAWKRFEAEGTLQLSLSVGAARFRGTYLAGARGPSATFRSISRVATTEELELPGACRELAERRVGLVLVAGPAGGGRSTTLAAMIDHANRTRDANIVTLERPIEHLHEPQRSRVVQREIGRHAPSFDAGLSAAARSDVDVLLVSELTDAQSVRHVLSLAAGSLVLAAIHASSAPSAVERLLSLLPGREHVRARGALGEVLAAVVWQRLFRRIGGVAKPAERSVAAHELLLGTASVLAAIRDGKSATVPVLLQAGRREGMIPLDASLEQLVEGRQIAPLEALERANDKEAFRRMPAVRAVLPPGG